MGGNGQPETSRAVPAPWAGFSLSQEHPKSLLSSATAQGSWDSHHCERAASKAGEGPHGTRTLAPVRALRGRGRKARGMRGLRQDSRQGSEGLRERHRWERSAQGSSGKTGAGHGAPVRRDPRQGELQLLPDATFV